MIIDASMFAWETELLEIRLHELDSVVDKFVVVEALECHGSGNKKAANFPWEQVETFKHKIKYVLLDKLEPILNSRHDVWPRENYHRNAIMGAIQEFASPSDVLLISDADEIARASTLRSNIHRLQSEPFSFTQDLFYYNVNTLMGSNWHGTVGGTVGYIQRMGGPQAARNRRDELPAIPDGGWHFSYFGGMDRIRNKVQNFAHSVDDICTAFLNRDREEQEDDIIAGRDLYHRPGERSSPRASNDPRLPSYLLNNAARFPQFFRA